ncbi:MAG: hypothetical protein OXF08_00320, partial [Bacteroidetes bacterium]|nr:hypothetical protein [Bacteroidota bacterium]
FSVPLRSYSVSHYVHNTQFNEQLTLIHGHTAQGTAIGSRARGCVRRMSGTINRQNPRFAIALRSTFAIVSGASH